MKTLTNAEVSLNLDCRVYPDNSGTYSFSWNRTGDLFDVTLSSFLLQYTHQHIKIIEIYFGGCALNKVFNAIRTKRTSVGDLDTDNGTIELGGWRWLIKDEHTTSL